MTPLLLAVVMKMVRLSGCRTYELTRLWNAGGGDGKVLHDHPPFLVGCFASGVPLDDSHESTSNECCLSEKRYDNA